jgi:uncharacterized protein YjeT (DUF2065 family)
LVPRKGSSYMKSLTPLEKSVVIFGLLLILAGAWGAVFPQQMIIDHPAENLRGKGVIPGPPEPVSKNKCRLYGVLSMAFGCGVCWIPFYRPAKSRPDWKRH